MTTKRTPKVFNANYQPPQERGYSGYKKLWTLILLLVIVVGLYMFFNLPYFSVKNIEIIGANEPTTVSLLNSLKGQSIFSSKLPGEVAAIKQKDLLLLSLNCNRGIPSTLLCADSLRTTSLIWQSGGTNYAVDSDGDTYTTLPTPVPGTLIVQDKSNQAISLGNTVASSAIIAKYQEMNSKLVAAGFTISNFFITDTLYQVGVVTSGNSKLNWAPATPINLLLTTSSPIGDQISTIVSTIQANPTQVTSRIDARVPGYVYLK